MHKYRLVEELDCCGAVFECMSCRYQWGVVGPLAKNYCGNCGVKFEGEMNCRPHDVPRWRYTSDNYRYEFPNRQKVLHCEWVIESMYPGLPWGIERTLRGDECTAANAKHWLEFLRFDDDDQDAADGKVYRVRVVRHWNCPQWSQQ